MTKGREERLGRGLGALLGDYLQEETRVDSGEIRTVSVAAIHPNPFQPRKEFDPAELAELAESIRENGLLQPLIVRPRAVGRNTWELVAGERRLRAISQLGWEEAPALVREVDDQTLLVLALVENLQREALGPLEEAEGYRVLVEEFGLTQAEIARAMGKDRSTVANTLRLLQLPPSIRKFLADGTLTAGHARPLLAVEDSLRAAEIAKSAVKEGWSVRQVEEVVKAGRGGHKGKVKRKQRTLDPTAAALQEELRNALGTRVVLRQGRKGDGVIEVPFLDSGDFERVFLLLTGRDASEVLE